VKLADEAVKRRSIYILSSSIDIDYLAHKSFC